MFSKLPLSLIKNPKGTFCFVGRVPEELAFVYTGKPENRERAFDAARHCGPGFARHYGLNVRTFPTREDVVRAATDLGFTPVGPDCGPIGEPVGSRPLN